jgi:hypothetical protein
MDVKLCIGASLNGKESLTGTFLSDFFCERVSHLIHCIARVMTDFNDAILFDHGTLGNFVFNIMHQ